MKENTPQPCGVDFCDESFREHGLTICTDKNKLLRKKQGDYLMSII